MISARICDRLRGANLRSFVDSITTRVCLPDGAQPLLALTMQEPGYLRLESDGEEITVLPVDPTTRAIPLADLLGGSLAAPAVNPLRSSLVSASQRRANSNPIRDFKVIITRDADGSDIAATFDFQLMPRADFESALAQLLSSRRKPTASAFEVDAALAPAVQCWNCHHTPVESPCPSCGADQDED